MSPISLISFKLRQISRQVRALAVMCVAGTLSALRAVKLAWRGLARRGRQMVRRRLALVERRIHLLRYVLQQRLPAHGWVAGFAILLLAMAGSFLLAHRLQQVVQPYFNSERLGLLRNLLATTGGALVGATAIGFSVVMIAVQLNFARMPHGLFRKLSSDLRLLGAFAATFLLAIGVSALSLAPDATWSARVLIGASWATLFILILFLYGYRRALDLISPAVQLRLILDAARRDLRRWASRATRMAPHLAVSRIDEGTKRAPSDHDIPRLLFFKANPQWTSISRRSVAHAISFARRYSEQGDYEVSASALNTVTSINAHYVAAKGKTFFAHNAIFDIPQATDGFINETLEHLRQLAQVAATRGDEEPIRQALTSMAALVQTYMAIDYASPHNDTKEHAHLAASYLAGAVESLVPHKKPDVVMEGIRLMGASARLFLFAGKPNDIRTLTGKIATLSCTGVVSQDYRAVTLTGMEQLSSLTFDLLRTQGLDIRFAAEELRSDVELIVQMFLNVPDTPFASTHSTYLAPYYSLTKSQSLGERLTDLCNAVIALDKGDKNAVAIARNIKIWADKLYQTQKKLLLLAIEKRSGFTFDILHWVAHVTKLLTAIAQAPATSANLKGELEEHASWLISVFSWIPDDKDTTSFVANFSMTELLFEAALDALVRGSTEVWESTRRLLINWAFNGGRHQAGWAILEQSLLGLAALVLWKEELGLVVWLKDEIGRRLSVEAAPDQELRDRAARELRRQAVSFRRREFETSAIRNAANQVDRKKMRVLLIEVADLLSPGTATEPVRSDFV